MTELGNKQHALPESRPAGPPLHLGRPPRLAQIFQSYEPPLYFVTANTWQRRQLLADDSVHQAFRAYALKNAEQGRAIGRYVIMPDHLHFFARLGGEFKLSVFVQLLKQALTKVLKRRAEAPPFWQPGTFDHVLRNSESYAAKWQYVRENPVRADLARSADEWPYQGEIVSIDRA